MIPVLSLIEVNAASIGKSVFESTTIDSSKISQRGFIFLTAYTSSLPTPPDLFEETKPFVQSSPILKAKSSELLLTGRPTFLTLDHFPSTFFE